MPFVYQLPAEQEPGLSVRMVKKNHVVDDDGRQDMNIAFYLQIEIGYLFRKKTHTKLLIPWILQMDWVLLLWCYSYMFSGSEQNLVHINISLHISNNLYFTPLHGIWIPMHRESNVRTHLVAVGSLLLVLKPG